MPFQPMYFDKLTPEQMGMPNIPQAVGAGQDIISKMIAQRLSDLEAQKAQAVLPYAAPTAAADLQYKQLTNEWLPKLNQSTIGLQGAQAGLYGSEARHYDVDTKYLPLERLTQAAQVMNRGDRFGGSYELIRMLNSMDAAKRAQWISENQQAFNDAMKYASGKVGTQSINPIQDMLQGELSKLYGANSPYNEGAIKQDYTASPYLQQSMAAFDRQPDQINLPVNDFKSTPELASNMADTGFITANRKNSTNFTNQRVEGAITLHKTLQKLLNEPDPADPRGLTGAQRLINATKYAGQTGAAQRYFESKLPASMQSVQYKDWFWAEHQFKPTVTNIVKNMEKLSIQPSQRKEIRDMVAPFDSLDLGRKDAIQAVDSAISTLQKAGDGIIESGEPVKKGVYKKVHGLKDLGAPLQEYIKSKNKSTSIKDAVRMTDGVKVYRVHPEDVDKAVKEKKWKRL